VKTYKLLVITLDRDGHRQMVAPELQSDLPFPEFTADLMRTGLFLKNGTEWIPPHCIMRVWLK